MATIMVINLDNFNVIHNEAEQQFELIAESRKSLLAYHRTPGVISFDHTEVPPELEGQGIATKMTRAALDFARTERLRVVPACSYVAAFIRKNAEYQGLLAAGKK
jgi:predicted GNAT family acetyltransferase